MARIINAEKVINEMKEMKTMKHENLVTQKQISRGKKNLNCK